MKILRNREKTPDLHTYGSTLETTRVTIHMNPYKLPLALKTPSVLAAFCVLAASYSVKAQEAQWQNVQPTP